ncbi:MAG TPA: glycosyltransferase family 39 protein [Terriglobia bacterium]|nr:glycosyltransferase family 39 protein [Terriglobia bacterium]
MLPSDRKGIPFVYWLIVCVTLLIAAVLVVSSALQDSQTQDEAVHLVSGYSYWKTGDFRLSPEHPPLSKLIASLPLLWLRADFSPPADAWEKADPWRVSKAVLYSGGVSADSILMAGRMLVIAQYLALAATLAWWVGRAAGHTAGFAALLLFAFEPTVLAHSRYVTTDIPVTLFIWLACLSWYSYLQKGGNWALIRTGVLSGLAFATKFSALFLPIVFVLTWSKTAKPKWSMIPILVGIALFAAISTYGFNVLSVAEDPRAASQMAERPLDSAFVREAVHVRIPGYYFLRGIQLLLRDQIGGYHSYFMGEMTNRSTWMYFPVAFVLKSSLAWLALLGFAGIVGLTHKRRPELVLLATPVLVYFAFTMTSAFNIGIRHLLPIYPFLCAFTAIALFDVIRKPYIKVAASVLVALFLVESASAYPGYLSFFNAAAGGTQNGHRYLLDSNLDWGQDLKRLAQYTESRKIENLCLSYFGTADPAFYGIHYRPLPHVKNDSDLENLNCVAAVSLQHLYATNEHPFGALRSREPTDRVGASISVYDLRR